MANKKTKKQKDLFGNPVKERDFKKRIYEIEENINPSEDSTEFNHDLWEEKAEKFREMGDKGGELQVYNTLIKNSGFTSPYVLMKGIVLVDMGEFDEAMNVLKSLYGCESHDTIVAPAQLQMARVSAIQGKKKDMIKYLKKAMRTTIFFNFSSGYYSNKDILKDIYNISEFDKYRDTEEFQEVLNFEWEREDEIELENKIKHYIKEKRINPEQIDPIRLRLIEYLCKYIESDMYLNFDLGANWMVNTSHSILVVDKDMLNFRGRSAHYASFDFSQDKLNSITQLGIRNKDYHIKDVVYSRADVELALRIVQTSVDVYILENPHALVITFADGSSPYVQASDEYSSGTKRRNEDYLVIVFPSLLKGKKYLVKFIEIEGSQKFFEAVKIIKKNYPEKFESLKFNESVNRRIDPLKYSFTTLFNKIKSEIGDTKDNYMKLEILLEYARVHFSYFSEEESISFNDYVDEIVAQMLKKATIDEIKTLIRTPKEILYTLIKSTEGQYHSHAYYRMSYFFELIRDKIEMIEDDHTRLIIFIYFDKHGGRVKNFNQELKAHFIKAEVPIIKTLLDQNYVRRLSKAERTEIIGQIELDNLRDQIMLFELLYRFSKNNVQMAKTILNKELEESITRFNGKALKQLINKKYFSYMPPEQMNTICTNIDFEQILTELNFIEGVQLLERLSKMGYNNAQETIKNQALKLALDNKVNTATKTFKRYVSDEELANLFKA